MKRALVVGNSDGIGLAMTRELLRKGWRVFGISRSTSEIENPLYHHSVATVESDTYTDTLKTILSRGESPDVCIYCVGIGEPLDLYDMEREVDIIEVNLLGMVKTAACVIPMMIKRGSGHFIGLSSVADELLSAEAPSYHASKAGFSNYLEGLALGLRSKHVYVTNVRFGFVDTKMAKGDRKPFMMSVDRAVQHLFWCLEKKPIRYTAPKIAIPFLVLIRWILRLKTILA
jgi:short-subunit dehydrogenase